MLIYLLHKQSHTREANLYLAVLESAAWAIPTVMLFSPEYPLRASYPSVIYLLAASCYALEQTGTEIFPYNREWLKKGCMVAGGAFFTNVIASLLVDADFYCQMESQIKQLKREDKKKKVTLGPIDQPPIYSFIAQDRLILTIV